MPYQQFDPNKPLQPQTSGAPQTGGTGGYVPFNPNPAAPSPVDQTKTAGPPSPSTPGGQDQRPDWSVDWRTGDVKLPQSAQDWGSVAAEQSSMGLLGLKAQADAARKRLGGPAAASADIAGNIASPTTLLNLVPYVGPELAGAVHEGIKSAAEGNDWKTVGEDTAAGGLSGLLGHGIAAGAPYVVPRVVSEGTKGGLTYLAHKLAGGLAGGDVMKEGLGLLGIYSGLTKAGEWAGEQAKDFASSPATRQAIQNLILSGGSAARQQAGPWDQFMPGP